MKYRRKHGIIFVTILIGMLLTAGCGKAKESNVTVGNKVPQLDTSTETSKKKTKGSDKKQESEEKTEENRRYCRSKLKYWDFGLDRPFRVWYYL